MPGGVHLGRCLSLLCEGQCEETPANAQVLLCFRAYGIRPPYRSETTCNAVAKRCSNCLLQPHLKVRIYLSRPLFQLSMRPTYQGGSDFFVK